MIKIGSPLFILRDKCKEDLMTVLGRLAEIGYDGIEFLGLFGHKASDIKNTLDSLNVKAIGDHVGYNEFVNETDKVIDVHKELGCGYITVGSPFSSGDEYGKIIDNFNKLGEAMNKAGMKLLFHNHREEVVITENGKSILDNLMDDTNPDSVFLEPDLGWAQIGGADPAHYVRKYYNRCPVIHFKDFIPTKDGFLFRPTGYGVVDNAGLYTLSLACDPLPEWFVMDHDHAYDRDIYDDLKLSLMYFKDLMNITETEKAVY